MYRVNINNIFNSKIIFVFVVLFLITLPLSAKTSFTFQNLQISIENLEIETTTEKTLILSSNKTNNHHCPTSPHAPSNSEEYPDEEKEDDTKEDDSKNSFTLNSNLSNNHFVSKSFSDNAIFKSTKAQIPLFVLFHSWKIDFI